jgi:predicted dienelactone hydrolase
MGAVGFGLSFLKPLLHLSPFSLAMTLSRSCVIPRRSRLLNVMCFTGINLLVGCLGAMATARGAIAAERIFVSYNLLSRSIPLASLETYATTGKVDRSLAIYAQYAKPDDLKQLRTILLAQADLSPVAMSQFLYSPQGVVLLKRLGEVIKPESRISGFKAIRAALILAAADPDGLTLLNVLRKFPTRGLWIDVEKSLEIAASLERVVNDTQKAAAAVVQQSIVEQQSPAPPGPDLGNFPVGRLGDLRQRGPFDVRRQELTLVDTQRQTGSLPVSPLQSPDSGKERLGRSLPVDIYMPVPRRAPGPTRYPVIVISHGLGGDRTTFAYLAEHLASYGFGVLVPDHPGSNKQQLKALISGTAQEIAEPAEFINRPLDITFLLNKLEANPTLSALDFQQVGVIGQSFGGYTALAIAGAAINPPQLREDCQPQSLENTLNLSLLLQCQAEKLAAAHPPLQDARVKAVIAVNPIASSVLGPTGISTIQIPTLIVAGIADTVAPALPEQIAPFTWLTAPSKYLVTLDLGTHFSMLNDAQDADNPLDVPPEVIGPSTALARRYMSALSVAFFQTYVANQPAFRTYLNAAYVRTIAEPTMPLHLVRSFTPEQLTQAITRRRAKPSAPVPPRP